MGKVRNSCDVQFNNPMPILLKELSVGDAFCLINSNIVHIHAGDRTEHPDEVSCLYWNGIFWGLYNLPKTQHVYPALEMHVSVKFDAKAKLKY